MDELHTKLEVDFATFLKEKGFVNGSVIHEPHIKVSGREMGCRPTFLLIDPVNQERLAVVEAAEESKSKTVTSHGTKSAQEYLELCKKGIGDENLPAFYLTSNLYENSKSPFQIHTFNKKNQLEQIDSELFPTLLSLTSNKMANEKHDIKVNKDHALSSFKLLAYTLSFVLLTLVVLDFIMSLKGITLLTAERLALIGTAVILIIIPFSQKFKGLGVEWERISANQNAANNTP
ncbi:hypothetical protein HH219_21590 [Pseudoalteromonas sp. NEC-BIFX-2020_015]|uniref:hypothetical protein n=1 Tax=Pseudoalteromonas sp. NEC-BIFX-2020_015 TaxID=2729544 RepID=UPI001461565B|nr:hypothetical protein [Pseudoalteromonas sp. NEC-BIFX-2020_015]NMR28074.1 hypothetical protein [Pseudoalteromonas sp. NEC-BIFX-2020_015]